MTADKKWFVIVNPTSGNGSGRKKWPIIEQLLTTYGFDFNFAFTEYKNHSFILAQRAIKKHIFNIICVGGDGTLHNTVNGIMNQNIVPSKNITIGMIPVGTGNDWIKTHNIPNNLEQAIQIINNGNMKVQDLGKIEFRDDSRKPVFFNNLAGVGFDGFVVSKVHKYKHFGPIAYLMGSLAGLFSFKNFESTILVNNSKIKSKILMALVGLGKYSGGGMQLTENVDPFDGLFDISIAKDIGKLDILTNLNKLFNGKIVKHKKVDTAKSHEISISFQKDNFPFIQADGELVGKGNIKISIVPKAFSFYGI